jgi:hypothetical protein
LIERWKIEKVFKILDREISFVEIKDMSPERQKAILNNWNFIRDTFREICIHCAKCEGLMK